MPRPKKSLGQHFLRDGHYLDLIVQALEPRAGEPVVEIGAGHGALTSRLLEAGLRVQALEIDRELADRLGERFADEKRFSIIQTDARAFDYASIGPSFKVAGNLPYQSATFITGRLMDHAERIPLMILTYQREVARRITAGPGSKTYGWLSCLAQYHYGVEYLATIPPGAFWPPPKVHSGVVRYRSHPVPPLSSRQREALFDLIQKAFSHRRKTILNALAVAGLGSREEIRDELYGWGIDTDRRPESFSLDEFILMRKIFDWEKKEGRPAGRAADNGRRQGPKKPPYEKA